MNLESVKQICVPGELLSESEFERVANRWLDAGNDSAEGESFVRHLTVIGKLTDFQASAVLAGIPGPYMLGPYRVKAFLAAGRLGNVFQATHVDFGQPVALKIFSPSLSRDPERLARLGREARVGVLVDNLHVVKTYQVGKVGEVPFIALEELNGETLQQRLDRFGRLPYADACQLISQAAFGLDYLHSQEIVHRDICPANLWVTTSEIVKIMEFGAARDALAYLDTLGDDGVTGVGAGAELTMRSGGADEPLGHYPYMSAEQAKAPEAADVSTDLYSLGCTLYHCLTGQVPFPDRNPVKQMLRHATEPPRLLGEFVADIPSELQQIVSRLLEKDPKKRYDSAEEVATALEAFEPETRTLQAEPVNTEFLQWLQSGAHIEEVTEMEYDPEFQQFVDWVSGESLPRF